MRFVTVAAAHAALVHPALQEGAVSVHLVANLSVGVVERLAQELGGEVVEECPAVTIFGRDPVASSVTTRTCVDLLGRRDAAQLCDEPTVGQRRRGALCGSIPRPPHVPFARPVTGLAPDVDAGPRRPVAVRRGVVVLLEIRRVALGAHCVPRLVATRPVQRVVGGDALVGVQVEPALLLRIPGHGERLQAAPGKGHEVLLERIDAKGVVHLELGRLPVLTLGFDHVTAVSAEEAGAGAVARETDVAKVSEHALVRRGLHRGVVMGPLPGLEGARVAAAARLAADERDAVGSGRIRGPG